MTQIYKYEETKDGYETTYRLFVYADGTNKLKKWVYGPDGIIVQACPGTNPMYQSERAK